MRTSNRGFSRGAMLSIVVALLAVAAIVTAFLSSASPYVTVAQAREMTGNNLHVAGDLLKHTLRSDIQRGVVEFDLRDEHGEILSVTYTGLPPANMGEATTVVVVGGMSDGRFRAHRMLVKCPSKYEGEKGYAEATSSP